MSCLPGTVLQMFLDVLDKGTASDAAAGAEGGGASSHKSSKAVLPDLLLCCICWVLGEYGMLADKLSAPHRVSVGQVGAPLSA